MPVGGAAADGAGQQLLLGGNIEQGELGLIAAGVLLHVAQQHILGAQGLPVAIDQFGGLGRQADHVFPRNRLEDPRVAQVVANDAADVLGQHRGAQPAEGHHGHRNGAVDAAGDPDAGFLRQGGARQAQQAEQNHAKNGFHNERSSGVKIMVKER